jgi:hypothetical protein
MKTKTDPEIHPAYVAAYLDADGSIYMQMHTSKPGQIHLRVRLVAAKYPSTLEAIQGVYGGRLYSYQQTRAGLLGAHSLEWRGGNQIRSLLQLIGPHIISKRKQADLLLVVLDSLRPRQTITRELITQREEWARQMKKLNQGEF